MSKQVALEAGRQWTPVSGGSTHRLAIQTVPSSPLYLHNHTTFSLKSPEWLPEHQPLLPHYTYQGGRRHTKRQRAKGSSDCFPEDATQSCFSLKCQKFFFTTLQKVRGMLGSSSSVPDCHVAWRSCGFWNKKKGRELGVSSEYPTCPLLLKGLEARRGTLQGHRAGNNSGCRRAAEC